MTLTPFPTLAEPSAHDLLQRRFPGAGRAWVALFAMGLSPILSFWVYLAPNVGDFYFRFIFYGLALTGWLPPLLRDHL